MAKRIHRNETSEAGKRVWSAVDRAAKRAPEKAVKRIENQAAADAKKRRKEVPQQV